MAGFVTPGLEMTADRLNNLMLQYGTFAERPTGSAELENVVYAATDTGEWWQVRNGGWVKLLDGAGVQALLTGLTGTARLDYNSLKNLPITITPQQVTKLAGIETGATADLTAPEIVTLLANLTGNARLSHNSLKDLPPSVTGPYVVGLLAGLVGADRLSYNSLKDNPTLYSDTVLFNRDVRISDSTGLSRTGASVANRLYELQGSPVWDFSGTGHWRIRFRDITGYDGGQDYFLQDNSVAGIGSIASDGTAVAQNNALKLVALWDDSPIRAYAFYFGRLGSNRIAYGCSDASLRVTLLRITRETWS